MKSISVAIVGGESLAGKEVREVLRRRESAWQIHLIGADEEETGRITEEGDEPAVVTPMDAANLSSADVVILAGSAASSKKAYELLKDNAPSTPVVDLTRTLEELPTSRLAAPTAGVPYSASPALIAHPAAIGLATIHGILSEQFAIKRWLAEVFEPASELGQAGIDELHQQTVRLFSFQSLPKKVFDTQLAFSMLAAFGEDSPHSLIQSELTIERHLASLLANRKRPVMPSLRLLQAPVFHGYMISANVEFEKDTTVKALEKHLQSKGVDVRTADLEPPVNSGVAGEEGLLIGDIRADRNAPRAFWFWIALDNLRLPAVNAAQVVEAACP